MSCRLRRELELRLLFDVIAPSSCSLAPLRPAAFRDSCGGNFLPPVAKAGPQYFMPLDTTPSALPSPPPSRSLYQHQTLPASCLAFLLQSQLCVALRR